MPKRHYSCVTMMENHVQSTAVCLQARNDQDQPCFMITAVCISTCQTPWPRWALCVCLFVCLFRVWWGRCSDAVGIPESSTRPSATRSDTSGVRQPTPLPCLWPLSMPLFTRLLSEYWHFVTQSHSRVPDASRQAAWIALRQTFVLFLYFFLSF